MNKHERATKNALPAELKRAIDQATDPERELGLLQKFAAIGGPYFAWWAIRICIKHKRQFPDWITDYLGECADRMLSDDAKRISDARKTLLWIFGFPKNRPGPGGLFKPGIEVLKDQFAVNFALRLHGGEDDPVKARGDAGDEFLPGTEDRTLQRYLLEVFQLKKMPSTYDQWMAVFDRHLMAIATRYYDREVTDN
jgi:hypothetical protein